MQQRKQEIDDKQAQDAAYERSDAVRDLLAIQRQAMEEVCVGRVVRKIKRTDPKTGKEIEDIEYELVMGLRDPRAAIEATIELLRVQGKHPDQKTGAAAMKVNIRINTGGPVEEKPLDS